MEARGRGVVVRRLAPVILALALLLAPFRAVAPVQGAGPMVSALQGTAKSDFPKEIDFALQAQGAAQVTRVRLAYQVGDEPITRIARATFQPAARVDATYKIDLRQQYYPPGTVIHYRWLIQDQTGAVTTTPGADLRVVDPRFGWHSRTSGPITLHWYQGDDQFADNLLAASNKVFAGALASGRGPIPSPVEIYLYATNADYASALLVGSDPWVGGQAFPHLRVITLLAPPDQLPIDERSVAHELTHLQTDGVDDPLGPLPTWLDEGLSMVAEGPPDTLATQTLQNGVRAGRLLSIQSISGTFPEDTNQATLAYAESDNLVRYFLKTYGQDRLNRLIAAFRSGATPDQAFQQATGMSRLEFQQKWEASLGLTSAPSGPSATPRPSGSWLVDLISAPVNFVLSLIHQLQQLTRSTKG